MPNSLDPLIRDLLLWLGPEGRPSADVMDAWRTSCPRQQVWEEAAERSFVTRTRVGNETIVRATSAGRAFCRRG